MRLVLASGSPRRAALLRSAGLEFQQVLPKVSEDWQDLDVEAVAETLAGRKARAAADRLLSDQEDLVILSADTVVVLGSKILEKPRDHSEARSMLQALSSRTHRVLTGYCILVSAGKAVQRTVATQVRFKKLRDEEIEYYLGTDEWTDKAGAYGIQGAAAFMVETLAGSYTNVVGLPLAQVLGDLEDLGIAPGGARRPRAASDSKEE